MIAHLLEDEACDDLRSAVKAVARYNTGETVGEDGDQEDNGDNGGAIEVA